MATNIKQQGRGIFILDGGTEVKSSLLWDEETTAWKYFSNSPFSTAPTYYRTIPTLYRGISIIENEAQNVPFTVYNKSGKEIDNTEDWQNVVGFMPNPRKIFDTFLSRNTDDEKPESFWLTTRASLPMLLKDRDSKTLEIFPLDRLFLFFHTFGGREGDGVSIGNVTTAMALGLYAEFR